MFPDEEMLGVDLVIPDVTYVAERLHKLRGILITHGHEDHTGALPYVLPRLRLPNGKLPPIYCTRLTRGLIAVKLEEHRLLKETDLRIVRPGESVKLGGSTPSSCTSPTASRTPRRWRSRRRWARCSTPATSSSTTRR